jgi:hypothetical protein
MKAIYVAAALTLSLPLGAQAPQKEKPAAPQKKAVKQQTASLTGCVDERDDGYVLTDPMDLRLLAKLEGDDPEHSSYAKYLGQKVTVTGSLTKSGEAPSMRVRTIKSVSETCAP